MREAFVAWRPAAAGGHRVLLGAALAALHLAGAVQTASGQAPLLTNLAQLQMLGWARVGVSYALRLEGNVWWASPKQGRLVLQDQSGAEELELEWPGQAVHEGQRVRLAGSGTIVRRGAAFRIGAKGPVVDNNGVHPMIEKSGAVYLRAGRNPIRLEWFNGVEKYGLEVEYEGPGLSRQTIPDTALFRPEADPTAQAAAPANGLDWRCYETTGEVLPDFDLLTPIKTGTAANFNPGVKTREEHVALEFTGQLEVPREGLYTFYLRSDDGSRLFVGRPSLRLEVIGEATLPAPRRIAIGQTLGEGEHGQWVEVEGKVIFVREHPDGLQMELGAGAGRMRVEVADSSKLAPAWLLNRRVRAKGFCQTAHTTDGQKIAG